MEQIGNMVGVFQFCLVEKKKRTIALLAFLGGVNGGMKKDHRLSYTDFVKSNKISSLDRHFAQSALELRLTASL